MNDDLERELRELLNREASEIPNLPRSVRQRIHQSIQGGTRRRPRSSMQTPRLALAAVAGLLVGLFLVGFQNRQAVVEVLPASIRQIVAPSPTPRMFTCASQTGGQAGLMTQVTGIRSARQEGFDRLVFEFSTGIPSYDLTRQESATFTTDPSGERVSLDGAAGLRVVLRTTGGSPNVPVDSRPSLAVLREISEIGNSGGAVSYGVGLAAPACARVIELSGPPRLVIDFNNSTPPPSPAVTPSGSAAELGPFLCSDATGGTAGPPAHLVKVRAAHQADFDRIVFEFASSGGPAAVPPYEIKRQASAHFVKDPSGQVLTLKGSSGLRLVLRTTDAHTFQGSTDLMSGLPVLLEATQLGDFEGVVSWGMGLSRQSCIRVLELSDPPRLAIDITN